MTAIVPQILVGLLLAGAGAVIADRVARAPKGRSPIDPLPTGPTGLPSRLINVEDVSAVVPYEVFAAAAQASRIPAPAARLLFAHAALFTAYTDKRPRGPAVAVIGRNPMLLPPEGASPWTQTIEVRQTPTGPQHFLVGVTVFASLAAGIRAAWKALPSTARLAASAGDAESYVKALVRAGETSRDPRAFVLSLRRVVAQLPGSAARR